MRTITKGKSSVEKVEWPDRRLRRNLSQPSESLAIYGTSKTGAKLRRKLPIRVKLQTSRAALDVLETTIFCRIAVPDLGDQNSSGFPRELKDDAVSTFVIDEQDQAKIHGVGWSR